MTTGRINQVVERNFILLFPSFIPRETGILSRFSIIDSASTTRRRSLFPFLFHFPFSRRTP